MGTLDYLKTMKVVVGVPSMGMWYERFGVSLIHMLTYCQYNKIGQYKTQEIRVASLRGSILPNLRLDAIRHAMNSKATYLLFVDSDQTFPKDTIHRLIQHGKDCVAANIATKTIPAQPTARRKGPDSTKWETVYTDDKTGLEEVDRIGTGLMMLKVSVFEKIGFKMMEMRWKEEIDKYGGEDWPVCEALQAAGFKIYIDHDLSREVGHVGEYIFTHDVIGEVVQVPEKSDVAAADA